MIMNINFKRAIVLSTFLALACSCNESKYTPLNSEDSSYGNINKLFYGDSLSNQNANTNSMAEELHTVIVKEVLPTKKYVYIQVEEEGERFWIAVIKQEINIGETYYYRKSLLKTNFESKEHNKTFDKIYLVTNLVKADHGNEKTMVNKNNTVDPGANPDQSNHKPTANNQQNTIDRKGSIKIAELIKNYKKYEGTTVQVSGKCVKINAGIMDRNWIHIKDGSKDDYDLVITSETFVPEGTVITMKARVTLNKDFGAGYKYDLILENGILVP